MRHASMEEALDKAIFQSTHPKRDETCMENDILAVAYISIHSSQTGWDGRFPNGKGNNRRDFNPLIPNGMRHWGACWLRRRCKDFNPLIPNGMRLDSDSWSFSGARYFNPLIPNGMRRQLILQSVKGCDISIHSSQTGWDYLNYMKLTGWKISIHSSQTGWDNLSLMPSVNFRNFNPLIPNGMRLAIKNRLMWAYLFQSTHPVWDEWIEISRLT